tara:strand:- start:236 stop:403 length:168 start_codon:yes stop_codon:yes gene_type:complete
MNKVNIGLFGILLLIIVATASFIYNNKFQKQVSEDIDFMKSILEDIDRDIHELEK